MRHGLHYKSNLFQRFTGPHFALAESGVNGRIYTASSLIRVHHALHLFSCSSLQTQIKAFGVQFATKTLVWLLLHGLQATCLHRIISVAQNWCVISSTEVVWLTPSYIPSPADFTRQNSLPKKHVRFAFTPKHVYFDTTTVWNIVFKGTK